MRILVLNGPNLNLLGKREPEVYGKTTLDEVESLLESRADELGVELEFEQTNHEGVIIDLLHEAMDDFDGVILNAGAYTHYSYAIRDAVAAIDIPVVEMHISDISRREEFRRISVLSDVCIHMVSGEGVSGYATALDYLYCALKGEGETE